VKGLPGGYLRDLQEDRAPLLETGPLSRGVVSMLRLCLPRIRFDPERTQAALLADYTQATDLAEALVKKGLPFSFCVHRGRRTGSEASGEGRAARTGDAG